MASAALFVVMMDSLKYFFGIDPVKNDFEEIQQKKQRKKRQSPMVIRYIYVNTSSPQTLPEERITTTVGNVL